MLDGIPDDLYYIPGSRQWKEIINSYKLSFDHHMSTVVHAYTEKHTQTYTYVHTQIINNKINIKSTKYEKTESKQCTTRIIPHYQIGFIPNR